MRRTRDTKVKDIPEDKQIFRYWVEVFELKTRTVRSYIPTKKDQAQRPTEQVLKLEDGSPKLEVQDLDELTAQLRQRFLDAEYERTLFYERDRKAEERWSNGNGEEQH